jgi:hypothetical protein
MTGSFDTGSTWPVSIQILPSRSIQTGMMARLIRVLLLVCLSLLAWDSSDEDVSAT